MQQDTTAWADALEAVPARLRRKACGSAMAALLPALALYGAQGVMPGRVAE